MTNEAETAAYLANVRRRRKRVADKEDEEPPEEGAGSQGS